jgi:hypothetical protein
MMSAVMTDVSARVPPRGARVFALALALALALEDNHRSIAICSRPGLIEEMSRPHPSYRRLVTPHQPRPGTANDPDPNTPDLTRPDASYPGGR